MVLVQGRDPVDERSPMHCKFHIICKVAMEETESGHMVPRTNTPASRKEATDFFTANCRVDRVQSPKFVNNMAASH